MQERNIELELKLRLLSPDDWQRVCEVPALALLAAAPPRNEHLETWYFDTPDQDLQQAGLAYRIRLANGRWVATVKADETCGGGLHVRREWNIAVDEPDPSISCFQNTEAGPLLADATGDEQLIRQFSTSFDRRIMDIVTPDGSCVELAVDRGIIAAAGREEPFAEIELELKSGTPAAVLALGAALAAEIPLAAEFRSKYMRGAVLAGLAKKHDDAETRLPEAAGSCADVARILLTNQIHMVLLAYEVVRQFDAEAEMVHQLRIHLRRLRSLLSFVKPLTDPAAYDAWQEKLRALGSPTDDLRENDVFRETWAELIAGVGTLTPPPWLGMMLETERVSLVEKTAAALAPQILTPTLLAFWAWAADNATLTAPEYVSPDDFIAERLAEWFDAMLTSGKDTALDDIDGLHILRIQGKKLRYVLESLPQRGRKAKIVLARLKRLQDCLGQLRDTHILQKSAAKWMNAHASRIIHRDAGLLIGWTAKTRLETGEEYVRAWKRFKRAARRWQKDAK